MNNKSIIHEYASPEKLTSLTKAIVLLLIVGVMIGLFAVYANFYYVAIAIGGIAITFLVGWQFEAALLVYVLVACIPWGRTPDLATGGSGEGKGVFISEVMLGYLLVIWFVRYLLGLLPKDRVRSGFHVPILLYTLYSILCVINSFVFWDPHVDRIYQHISVNAIELGLRILCAGAFIMMATSISDPKWLKRISVMVLIPGLFNLVNSLAGGHIPLAAPWWPILMLLPASYCWAIVLDPKVNKLYRLLGVIAVGISVLVIFSQNISWVSGWLGLFAALGAVTFIKSKKVFVACLAVAAVLLVVFWPFFYKNVVLTSETGGDYDRFALLRGSLLYATKFPLGVGPGNYRTYNSFYYGREWGTTSYTSAHGTYSQHLSEMGIPGLVLFLAIPIGGALWLMKNYKNMRNGFSKTFVLAAVCQLIGISVAASVGDYIIPTYHNGGLVNFSSTVYSWLIWGIAVAHIRNEGNEVHGSINSSCQLEYKGTP